jgi:hypothetical protein
MLLADMSDKFTREQAERFVRNTPHHQQPQEEHHDRQED